MELMGREERSERSQTGRLSRQGRPSGDERWGRDYVMQSVFILRVWVVVDALGCTRCDTRDRRTWTSKTGVEGIRQVGGEGIVKVSGNQRRVAAEVHRSRRASKEAGRQSQQARETVWTVISLSTSFVAMLQPEDFIPERSSSWPGESSHVRSADQGSAMGRVVRRTSSRSKRSRDCKRGRADPARGSGGRPGRAARQAESQRVKHLKAEQAEHKTKEASRPEDASHGAICVRQQARHYITSGVYSSTT